MRGKQKNSHTWHAPITLLLLLCCCVVLFSFFIFIFIFFKRQELWQATRRRDERQPTRDVMRYGRGATGLGERTGGAVNSRKNVKKASPVNQKLTATVHNLKKKRKGKTGLRSFCFRFNPRQSFGRGRSKYRWWTISPGL